MDFEFYIPKFVGFYALSKGVIDLSARRLLYTQFMQDVRAVWLIRVVFQ